MSDQEEPKIIVDDDWKSQVQNEKAQLEQKAAEPASEVASDAADADMSELPPASLPMLISTLATQAMGCMGMLPDPATGQPNVHRPMAKHFIDTLEVLQEKTKGNLADDEETMLRDTLHQLRMAFMAMPKNPSAAEPEPKKSSIELP